MKSYADILDAYDKGRYHIAPYRKYRSTSSYVAVDLSYGAGVPIANYYASTPLVQTELTTKEGIFHGINNDKFLHKITIHSVGSSGAFLLLDYLSYIPFLDGDSTDEQVFDTHTLPRYSDGNGVRAILVSQGSGTQAGNATLKYTNSNGVAGRTAITFLDGTISAGYIPHVQTNFLQLQQGDIGIQKIESFTFSTGIGGIYALVLVKPVVTFGVSDINAPLEKDFFSRNMDMPKIHKDAYLNFVFKSMSSLTINLQAQLEFVW